MGPEGKGIQYKHRDATSWAWPWRPVPLSNGRFFSIIEPRAFLPSGERDAGRDRGRLLHIGTGHSGRFPSGMIYIYSPGPPGAHDAQRILYKTGQENNIQCPYVDRTLSPFNSHMVARHKANMYTGSPICFLLYLPATPFFTYACSIYQKRTASGQMLSPPYEVQIFCSRTGTPVWAAFTIQPGLVKMPTWTTPVLQSPPLPQKSRSPALACARGMCLPSLEAYCA